MRPFKPKCGRSSRYPPKAPPSGLIDAAPATPSGMLKSATVADLPPSGDGDRWLNKADEGVKPDCKSDKEATPRQRGTKKRKSPKHQPIDAAVESLIRYFCCVSERGVLVNKPGCC